MIFWLVVLALREEEWLLVIKDIHNVKMQHKNTTPVTFSYIYWHLLFPVLGFKVKWYPFCLEADRESQLVGLRGQKSSIARKVWSGHTCLQYQSFTSQGPSASLLYTASISVASLVALNDLTDKKIMNLKLTKQKQVRQVPFWTLLLTLQGRDTPSLKISAENEYCPEKSR